jgi:uncharacterized membrane protein
MKLRFNKYIWIILLILLPFIIGADSDEVELGITAVLFLSGFIFYILITIFYSGKDKRHFHERETESSIRDLKMKDTYIRSLKKSKDSSISQITYSNQINYEKKKKMAGKLLGGK